LPVAYLTTRQPPLNAAATATTEKFCRCRLRGVERIIVERTDEEPTNNSDFAAEANLDAPVTARSLGERSDSPIQEKAKGRQ
jgi:hypothetical protein